jgi:hypothetical protein
VVKAVDLARQYGDKNVGAAVVVIILKDRAHSRQAFTVRSQSHAGFQRAFSKSTIAIIMEQILLHAVVGDENVREAVAIIVCERDTERFALLGRKARPFRDVLECAVSTVVEELASCSGKNTRRAVGISVAAADFVVVGVPVHVASDKQVKMSVVVVIEEASRDKPASCCDASLGGYRPPPLAPNWFCTHGGLGL